MYAILENIKWWENILRYCTFCYNAFVEKQSVRRNNEHTRKIKFFGSYFEECTKIKGIYVDIKNLHKSFEGFLWYKTLPPSCVRLGNNSLLIQKWISQIYKIVCKKRTVGNC